MTKRWYDLDAAETARQTDTDLRTGLSSEEARKRLEANGLNTVFPLPTYSFWEDMRKTSVSTLTILLALTCVLSALFNKDLQSLILILLLGVNYLTLIVSYVKAKRILSGMGHAALPTAKVVRDGRMTLVRQEQIAVGDLICLSAGDIIPCDARLIEDNNLIVLESGITGAEGPVRKDSEYRNIRNIPPHEALNMVYASTIVKSGHGKAIACRCGKDCYVCSVGKNKAAVSYDKLAVFNKLRKLSYFITLAAILLTFLLTVMNMLPALRRFDALTGLLYALSFGCGAMSEFYAIFGYIIVSVGVFSSFNQSGRLCTGVLIKNAEKLSDMGKLTTLILPTEAVVAESDMHLNCIYLDVDSDRPYEVTPLGFDPVCSEILRLAVVSTGLYDQRLLSLTAAGDNMYTCEEEAILRSAKKNGLYTHELDEEYPLREHLGKSEYCPFETTLVRQGAENRVIVRGAADQILAACTSYRDMAGNIHKMNGMIRSRLSTIAAQMMRERGTVVGIATNYSFFSTLVRLSDTLSGMTFEGFLGFSEPLLPGVTKTVEKLRSAGIRVVLFTPDKSERNAALAGILGIVSDEAGQITDRAEIERMGEGVLATRLDRLALYQNMDPRTAGRVISLMQKQGEKVGYLGQKFEEIVTMRQADVCYTQSMTLSDRRKSRKKRADDADLPISVSKAGDGAPGGCDALRFVSDAIVSVITGKDSTGGLNAVCASIERARMIYRNINRLFTYLLTVNITRLLLLLWTFFSGNILLTPVQMLTCGLLFDLAAVMIIAFEKPDRDILAKGKSGRQNRTSAANFHAMLSGLFFGICLILSGSVLTSLGLVSASTVCTPVFLSVLIASHLILLESGKERSLFAGDVSFSNMLSFAVLSILALVGFGLFFPVFGGFFGIYRLPVPAYVAVLIPPILLLLFTELFKSTAKSKSGFRFPAHRRTRTAEKSSGTPSDGNARDDQKSDNP
ncbi:MAG: cation transporting ATPase C-terminal domain-containing protein [Eubacteriales bacterium]